MAAAASPCIAIFPTPGMGHLIPLLEFAKTLRHYNISSTFFIPTEGPLPSAQKSLLSNLPSSIDYILLPPVNVADLPRNVKIETRISVTVVRSLGHLREAVKSLHESKKFVALVVDLFGTDGFEISTELKIPQYIFFPSTAMLLSLFLYLRKLDETVSSEYSELQEKVTIPGCVPMNGRDLVAPLQDRRNDAYKWVLYHSKRYAMADCIMVNSFNEIEPNTLKYLREIRLGNPVVYPIGPLIRRDFNSDVQESCDCLEWLNEQPKNSVLFISFGSGGTLPHDQLIEVALGLELSEQRFLWVVRCPNDVLNSEYFKAQNACDPVAYLPDGFVERTKNRGLVVPFWAPQARVLAHDSICAFLSHCGWNSTLESVVNGVPLIAWPLYAEQRMNAVILNEDAKVALRPKIGENGLVDRVEIANVVKNLMDGEEGKCIRNRMSDLKDAAARVLGEDGSSTRSLQEVVNMLKSNGVT